MSETGQNLLTRIVREAGQFEGFVDDCRKIPSVNVLDIRPGHQTPGVEAVFIAVGRLLDAVCVEDDRAGEVDEFLGLILPCAAEVADQVGVFLQTGIAVGRQHFAVGVDVDPFPFGLLEQLFQHLQVVAGHQNGLASLGAELHSGRNRVAVGIGVGIVQQPHHGQVLLAALHRETYEIHQPQIGISGCCQRLLEEGHDFVIGFAEDHGVIHIGRHTLQAVHQDFNHGTDVFVDMLGVDAVGFALAGHAGQIVSRFPVGHRAGNSYTGCSLGLLLQLVALLDHAADTGRLEVNICDSCEKPLDRETVDLGVATQLVGIKRQAFQAVQQVILQCCNLRVFTAYTGNVTTDTVCCLFALVTKHAHFCFLHFH